MSVLDRYLFKEFIGYWYGITSILLLILLSQNLILILAEAIQGVVDSKVIVPLFITNVFQFAVTLIPLGLFLGIMMGMGRLYHESEMAAALACGLSPKAMLKPAFYVGLLGALLVTLFGFFITPWGAGIEQRIVEKQQARQEIDKLEAGKFNLSNNGQTVVFIQNKKDQQIEQVFIKTESEDGEVVELANSAEIQTPFDNKQKYFLFHQGKIYNFSEGEIRLTEYQQHGIRMVPQQIKHASNKMTAKTMSELLESKNLRDISELHWRIALPISAILLALIAVPLSHTAPRKGRYGKLVLGILVYVSYVNLLIFARKMIEKGTIPSEWGMWWLHILSFMLLAFLIYRRQKR